MFFFSGKFPLLGFIYMEVGVIFLKYLAELFLAAFGVLGLNVIKLIYGSSFHIIYIKIQLVIKHCAKTFCFFEFSVKH